MNHTTQRTSSEILDRLPPHNLDAEKGVLGSVLLLPSVLDDVGLLLRVEHFYAEAHQKFYRHLLAMHDAGQAVDVALLVERLKRSGDFEATGGAAYLGEVVHSVAVAAHAFQYAEIVVEKSKLRAIVHASLEALQGAYAAAEDPDVIAGRLEANLSQIQATGCQRRPLTAMEAAAKAQDYFERFRDPGKSPLVYSGLKDLDEAIGGLAPGELVILAARPSLGKTSLALQVAYYNACRGRKGLFVSLEMGGAELAARQICGLSGVGLRAVRTGKTDEADRRRLVEASNEFSRANLEILEDAELTLSTIRRWARKMRHDPLTFVCVDYLQLITPENPRDPREQQVARTTKGLKALARDLEVPVMVLCQLNRQADPYDEPELRHLRESGAIEQDADVVIFLYLHEPTDEEAYNTCLLVAKNRNGETGKVPLAWRKETTSFLCPSEVDVHEFPNYEPAFEGRGDGF